jgi:hypothetical protein
MVARLMGPVVEQRAGGLLKEEGWIAAMTEVVGKEPGLMRGIG